MTATGDTLRVAGRQCLISSHSTISKNPASTWYLMSLWTSLMALGVLAVWCAPASSIASIGHAVAQLTGTPCSQSFRWATKGCWTDSMYIGFSRLLWAPPLSFFCLLPVALASRVAGPWRTSANVAGLLARHFCLISLKWLASLSQVTLSFCYPSMELMEQTVLLLVVGLGYPRVRHQVLRRGLALPAANSGNLWPMV
jgi:hypothetical protein